MKRGKWIMALFLLGSAIEGTIAQKKWDGEGGDGLWSNERNWQPDGIPLPSDDVLINNQHVAGSFRIVFPGGTFAATVHSLSILPNNGDSISIELPADNTASPCLTMSSAGNAFRIGKGGWFINRSGASAGNPMVVNGSFLIENEGRYVHRTLRGNATLVAKLVVNPSTQYGIFEFDVPGNAGYTLSISGRQFGSLWLSSKTAGKKSYSGTGVSELKVHGDLVIADSSSFTSALNNNVLMGRNVKVWGKFLLNPTLADTIKRELLFKGDSTSLMVGGSISLGPNFRNIVVERGHFQLKSNMVFTDPNHGWKLLREATMMMGDFSLGGSGSFITDSASTLGIGSNAGISADSLKGNIRMKILSLHPKGEYIFYSAGDQFTGDRFPAEAAGIIINKPNGRLMLSNGIRITDSLGLISGNAITDSSKLLVYSGDRITASHQSFIIGPFRYMASSQKDMQFPVGKAGIYAPVIISKMGNDSSCYEVEYHPTPAAVGDSAILFPVRYVSQNEYWDIKKIHPRDNIENKDIIRLSLRPNSIAGIIGQPQLVRLAAGQNMWQLLPLYAANSYPNTIASIPTEMKTGRYTLGSMYPSALSLNAIDLCAQERNGFTKFSWTSSLDETVDRYVLEKSEGNGAFIPLDSVLSKNILVKTSYTIAIRSAFIRGYFIRIKSVGKKGKKSFSNIIFFRQTSTALKLYPNPAKDFIKISPSSQPWTIMGILNQTGQIIPAIASMDERGSSLNISQLPKGKYRLLLQVGKEKKTLPFLKE